MFFFLAEFYVVLHFQLFFSRPVCHSITRGILMLREAIKPGKLFMEMWEADSDWFSWYWFQWNNLEMESLL